MVGMEPSEAETSGPFADLFNFSDDLFLDDQHQQLSTLQPPPTTAAKTEGGEEETPTIRQEVYEDDEDFLESFPVQSPNNKRETYFVSSPIFVEAPLRYNLLTVLWLQEVTVDELRWVLNREGESAIDNLDALLSTTPESKPERPTAVCVLESAPRWWPAPQKKRTKGRQKKKEAFAVFSIPTKETREVPAAARAERRRCWHCAAEETPQWRAGPSGPKTLCNACGVRFKSGRLLPEYRPANSPTFSSELHSNSHRKVLEMRRWKDKETVSSPLSAATAAAPASAADPASAAGQTRRREQKGGVVGNPRVGTVVSVRNFY